LPASLIAPPQSEFMGGGTELQTNGGPPIPIQSFQISFVTSERVMESDFGVFSVTAGP
jgi:hypothetical protein